MAHNNLFERIIVEVWNFSQFHQRNTGNTLIHNSKSTIFCLFIFLFHNLHNPHHNVIWDHAWPILSLQIPHHVLLSYCVRLFFETVCVIVLAKEHWLLSLCVCLTTVSLSGCCQIKDVTLPGSWMWWSVLGRRAITCQEELHPCSTGWVFCSVTVWHKYPRKRKGTHSTHAMTIISNLLFG